MGGERLLNVGDKVFYPMHGAGVISGIEENEVNGVTKSYYVLHMPMGSLKVMLPVDHMDKIGLRDIIPKEKVEEIRQVLADRPDRMQGSWNKRFHANLERMKSGDILDVAAVARNLTLQDRKRRISSGERRLMDLSRQILVSELTFVCESTPEEMMAWVDEILSKHSVT
ncbi:MAG: CarD family transcriptional regulator [Selenomonadaceae bacterium]|nr:CarD family transcriptional regulator [Selenomonadaceae bacterium]MBR0284012.1 CarD family transcriptional regulator [Selenomonadaceae bacterium]MBR6342351.1 CarD family transcriptional regulator [Selenomonadaceae bacterium]MBR6710135.1 CarD family transcriptional regulator [Selenomonadaceae bacterium]MBR6905393.1 CarD family transcriptional regulator [Selenomonadaceae bacterium]